METAIIREQQALQASGNNIEDVITAFISQLDCKESSRKLYTRTIKQFFAWVQRTGRSINALTRVDILNYRDGLIDGSTTTDGKAKSSLTAAAYLTSVKLFYVWAEAVKLYPNIAAGVKLPKREKRFEKEPLTNEQAAALLSSTAETNSLRNTAIVNLLLRTGLRTIEVVRANIEDLQTKAGTHVLYVQGKGHTSKDNFVILSPKCYAAVAAYLSTREDKSPEAPLFTCDSNNNKGGRMTTRTISAIAKENLKSIGLDSRSYTAHSLRHTCACSLLEETGDLHLVQMTLRHSNPATTQIYTYHTDERRRLRAAAEVRLDNLF